MSDDFNSISTNIYTNLRDDLQKVWIRENLKHGKGFVIVDIVENQVQTFYMPLDSAKKELIEIVEKSCSNPIGSDGYRHFMVNLDEKSNIFEEQISNTTTTCTTTTTPILNDSS